MHAEYSLGVTISLTSGTEHLVTKRSVLIISGGILRYFHLCFFVDPIVKPQQNHTQPKHIRKREKQNVDKFEESRQKIGQTRENFNKTKLRRDSTSSVILLTTTVPNLGHS